MGTNLEGKVDVLTIASSVIRYLAMHFGSRLKSEGPSSYILFSHLLVDTI